MRRTRGGWLAAVVLLVAGCGTGGQGDLGAPDAGGSPAVPTIAVAARAPAPAAAPAADGPTILVTSPGGVDAAGLDALVTVLLGRPGTEVVAVAPVVANDARAETDAPAAVLDATTASGYPVRAVNASAADAIATAVDRLGVAPDLVIVGIDEGAAVGSGTMTSAAVGAAQAAVAREVPALVVAADDRGGGDVAAAGLFVAQLLDLELDQLLAAPAITVLSVPSCDGGTVRGPVRVDHDPDAGAGEAVCTDPDPGGLGTDVEAHAAGYASLTTPR